MEEGIHVTVAQMPNVKLKAELIYTKYDSIVPAKAFAYKKDPVTQETIELIKPRTHKFENSLKEELSKQLDDSSIFPVSEEILVSIILGLHAEKEYQTCDLDNRIKTILDALKSVIYIDDRQVKMIWSEKVFLRSENNSFFQIKIKILNDKIINQIKKYLGGLI